MQFGRWFGFRGLGDVVFVAMVLTPAYPLLAALGVAYTYDLTKRMTCAAVRAAVDAIDAALFGEPVTRKDGE